MNKTIAVIQGDGIGPEIVGEAIGVLDAVAAASGIAGHISHPEEVVNK